MANTFDGNTWQISDNNGAAFSGHPITMAGWIRKANNALRCCMALYSTSDSSRFWLGMNGTGNILAMVTSTTGTTNNTTGTSVMANNQWVHIAVVSPASNLRRVYVNGNYEAQTTVTRTLSTLDLMIIGGTWTGGTSSSQRYTGDMAEFCIYNKGFSDGEITALYRGGVKSLPANNLVFWDRMIDINRKDLARRLNPTFTSGTNTLTTSHPRVF